MIYVDVLFVHLIQGENIRNVGNMKKKITKTWIKFSIFKLFKKFKKNKIIIWASILYCLRCTVKFWTQLNPLPFFWVEDYYVNQLNPRDNIGSVILSNFIQVFVIFFLMLPTFLMFSPWIQWVNSTSVYCNLNF